MRAGALTVAELTYREAAVRVRRSVRTMWRWRKQGMPMGWAVRDGQRVRVVDEEILLEWYRARLQAWPIHQQMMARKRREGIQG